jgi:ABC-2 type transport system permease protein
MQVFNTYFKIVKKNMVSISIYFFVFLFISILITGQMSDKNSGEIFSSSKSRIAVFNYDKNSEFSNGFESFLSKHANIITVNDTQESLQDALYFRNVVYIVKIPNGFGESIQKENNIQIEKTAVAGSTDSIYMDFLINKYMNTAEKYIENIPNITNEQLNTYLEKDMSIEANIKMEAFGEVVKTESFIEYYFKYYAYVIFAIIILGVTTIIFTFNNRELKKRNLCSPIKQSKYNFQIILASLVFTIIVWALICSLSIPIYGSIALNKNTILLFANALIISLVVLSISFLLGNVMKSKGAINAISNILTLGLSFLSGVFVPQEFMSAGVLKIASFTPTYWYVKAVDSICSLTTWNSENIMPIVNDMLIEMIFAVAILAISLVIVKQKRSSNQI